MVISVLYPGQETEPKADFQEKLAQVHSSTLVVFEVEFRARFGGGRHLDPLDYEKNVEWWPREAQRMARREAGIGEPARVGVVLSNMSQETEFQLTAGGNANWYNHHGNQWKFLKNQKLWPYDSAMSLLGMYQRTSFYHWDAYTSMVATALL